MRTKPQRNPGQEEEPKQTPRTPPAARHKEQGRPAQDKAKSRAQPQEEAAAAAAESKAEQLQAQSHPAPKGSEDAKAFFHDLAGSSRHDG